MRAIGTAVVAAFLVGALAAQPQSPPAQPPAVFRAGADLIEVDVVVHDKDGRFVPDLSADDFSVEESGSPQPIQQFYLHLTDRWRWADGSAAAPVLDATPPSIAAVGRVFVVVFDSAHLTPAGFKRTQAAAQSLFAQQFRQGDMGGVVVRGRMVRDRLTSDRDELLKAVRDARPESSKDSRLLFERQYPRLSETEAVRIVVNNDRVVMDEAMRRACADDPELCRAVDPEAELRGKASQLAETARAESNVTLQILRGVANGLVRVPGRKTIVLMSEGFIAEDAWPMVQESVALAARANARIYTLDARGLDRGMRSVMDVDPGGSDANQRLLEQMDFGADSMNSLAVDTGGFVVRNTNQFDKAMARIGEDGSNYYVLGIRPAAAPDEKFHRLSVKVKRAGLAVRARRGYIATARPASVLTAVPAPTAIPSAAPTVESTRELPAAAPGPAIDPASIEPMVVPRTEPASGYRVRPDADAHARTLAASSSPDADASAGWEAYQRGDVETARVRLAAAAGRPAANPWVHYTLGMASYALRQYRDAAIAWERVRAGAPDFEPVYFDLVDAYLQLREHDQAIRIARGGMERWPRDPELANALGVVQTVRGSLDDAVKSFQSAVTIAPTDATGYFNLGKAMELRYSRSRRYVQQLRSWVSNESDRNAAMENYQRYLDLGGAYADAARAGLERLKWMPTPKG